MLALIFDPRIHWPIALAITAGLTGCDQSNSQPKAQPIISAGKPSETDMGRIERALVGIADSCVGDINRWVRLYKYRYWQASVDHRYIVIDMNMPVDAERVAGRYAVYADAEFHVDDRDIVSAFGIFDRQRSKIDYWHCGGNFPAEGIRDDPMKRPSLPVE